MKPSPEFKKILRRTRVLKGPRHRLSTFGQTKIQYFFLSETGGLGDRTRLRQGVVMTEKPRILTPGFLKDRFEGFGERSAEFGRFLSELYGEGFRGLEYRFKNDFRSASVEYSSKQDLFDQIKNRLTAEEDGQSAILEGPDRTWQISLMKFIVDECLASFDGNVRDLERRGFFDSPGEIESERRREIETLFARARKNRGAIPQLGKKLEEYGLFKEYEDEFFSLTLP